jgi:hypothetical protein
MLRATIIWAALARLPALCEYSLGPRDILSLLFSGGEKQKFQEFGMNPFNATFNAAHPLELWAMLLSPALGQQTNFDQREINW